MPESGQLVVHYIDVGQGDCIYIAFPDGTDMLIDCGSEKGRKEYETSAISDLKELNPDGKIDRVMATHSDTDHISYLDEVLSEFQVGNVYMPNIRSNNLDKSVKIGGRDVKVGDLDAANSKSLPIKIQSTLKDIPSFHCGVIGAELQYHAQYRKIRNKRTRLYFHFLLSVAGRVG